VDGDVCPGPIRVLRTTRAPCIAAFGNLEPARAALLLLLRARRQRRVAMAATARARSVAPQPLGRCHESQSLASTAQQTRTAPHRKSARSSWGTVELICRRRFSTKNLRRYTVRVTRSPPPRVLGLGSAIRRRRGVRAAQDVADRLSRYCHGLVRVCVCPVPQLRDWATRHAPETLATSGAVARARIKLGRPPPLRRTEGRGWRCSRRSAQ
jgi:hypothetical protein